MPFKFYTLSVRDDGTVEQELNAFLCSHRVLAVDRRWVEQGSESFWTICVDYLEGSKSKSPGGSNRTKVDYKEILPPEDFAVFAKLRDLRKQVAQSEAVPVYTVFTNEQLAEMVRGRAESKAALESIAGVGDARIEKYGPAFLDLLSKCWSHDHEASRKPR